MYELPTLWRPDLAQIEQGHGARRFDHVDPGLGVDDVDSGDEFIVLLKALEECLVVGADVLMVWTSRCVGQMMRGCDFLVVYLRRRGLMDKLKRIKITQNTFAN